MMLAESEANVSLRVSNLKPPGTLASGTRVSCERSTIPTELSIR